MHHKIVRVSFVVGLLTLGGAGCQTPSATTSTPTITPPVVSTSACEHPYYPLKPGYEVTYQSSYDNNSSGYSLKVTDGTADSVKLHLQFNSGTYSDQTIKCRDGNLEPEGYVDIASAMESKRANITTKSVEGYYLPKEMSVGSDWTAKYDVEIDMTQITGLERMGKIEGTITIHRKVVGEESVTVPAGTFDALKIQAETNIDTHLTGGSVSTGSTATIPGIQTTEWWVKGKGMVKSVMPASGLGANITAEATSIVVP